MTTPEDGFGGGLHCPPGTPISPLPMSVPPADAHLGTPQDTHHYGSPMEGYALHAPPPPPSPVAVAPAAAAAAMSSLSLSPASAHPSPLRQSFPASSFTPHPSLSPRAQLPASPAAGGAAGANPKLFSAKAAIMSTETRSEDKRFTAYKIDVSTHDKVFSVFHRYSEFRELYDHLKEKYGAELTHIKFPGKRLVGNFDPSVIQARQRALQEFVQAVLASPVLSDDAAVRSFFVDSARHTHVRHGSDEAADVDDGQMDNRFELGECENKKARISDFTMLKVIGKGSFGKVILARHNATQQLFAVKVLNKDAIIRQNEIKHIMSERNVLLGNVHHPFLVGLQYSFQTSSKLYFVLNYASGGELFFHLQREKRFAVPRALFYAAEITSALGYLHSLNIVYRDLKPENILFDQSGHVVLTDFGLCKENVRPGGTTSTFCGTPEYLAPEVLRRQAYGRPVDWWCLGCVTYEMMCGLPPFYSRHNDEMFDRILHDSLRFPEHVPPAARELLQGLLSKDPHLRLGSGPTDAAEVKSHRFFEAIDWAALDRKEIPPPWVPAVADALDLRHFDAVFVNEPVPQSVAISGNMDDTRGSQPMRLVSVSEVNPFIGFSFAGDPALKEG